MLSLAGRSIRSADGRPDRRTATKTRFHTDFTGGFYHFSTSRSPTPFPAPSPSTCRRRRRNKHLRLHCFNGLIRFFLFAGRCGSTENGRCEAKSTRCSASSRQEGRQEIWGWKTLRERNVICLGTKVCECEEVRWDGRAGPVGGVNQFGWAGLMSERELQLPWSKPHQPAFSEFRLLGYSVGLDPRSRGKPVPALHACMHSVLCMHGNGMACLLLRLYYHYSLQSPSPQPAGTVAGNLLCLWSALRRTVAVTSSCIMDPQTTWYGLVLSGLHPVCVDLEILLRVKRARRTMGLCVPDTGGDDERISPNISASSSLPGKKQKKTQDPAQGVDLYRACY